MPKKVASCGFSHRVKLREKILNECWTSELNISEFGHNAEPLIL